MIEKNKLITAVVILALGVVGFVYMRPAPATDVEVSDTDKKLFLEKLQEEPKEALQETPVETAETIVENVAPATKEFSVDAYYDSTGMWFSIKEINVNKGDNVKIKVKNIKGMHNFNIDEYDVKKDLPLDEEVSIEFVADKAGDFIYYCSIPGHREKGQWGTLKVSE